MYHIYPNESNEQIHPKLNKSWYQNNFSLFFDKYKEKNYTDSVECTVL